MRISGVFLFAVAISACSSEDYEAPDVLVLSVLPDQSPAELEARNRPLVEYLRATTGLAVELSLDPSYEELLDDFAAGRVHIVNFGGTTYVQAERQSDAEPLVMRDIDLEFVSCYIARESDPRRRIDEFEGEDFAFGPTLSTSGHLMPRYFLMRDGIVPETFFGSVTHTASHDRTAFDVADGTVAIGVVNCEILIAMNSDGRLGDNDIRILGTTPPYPNYVWASQARLDPAIKTRVRDAFLALDLRNPEHRTILDAQGAAGYLPASDTDFDDVRSAVTITTIERATAAE